MDMINSVLIDEKVLHVSSACYISHKGVDPTLVGSTPL